MKNYRLRFSENPRKLLIEIINTSKFTSDLTMHLLEEMKTYETLDFNIEIDLTQVQYIDSSAIGFLYHIGIQVNDNLDGSTTKKNDFIKIYCHPSLEPFFQLFEVGNTFSIEYTRSRS